MNRLLLYRYRGKNAAGANTLSTVYYYYDGATFDIETTVVPGQLTPQQMEEYPPFPGAGYLQPTICVDNRVRRFLIVLQANRFINRFEDTNETCGIACDLLISSLDKVDATPGEADGSITVVAATSNPVIEYRLRSLTLGQVVADWQLSPIFGGLGIGAYQAFARDALGCLQDKAIYLPESPPLNGERYRAGYVDRRGRQTRISIFQRGYSGPVVERLALKGSLSIQYDGDTSDKFQPIYGSSATINLYAESRADFVDLYTADDRKHRVEIYKDNVIFWIGWLIADYYEDEYVRERGYGVTLKAVDGLGDLKQSFYQTTEKEPYEGFESQMIILRRCLAKTGLDLPMRTGINVYETRMLQGNADDPLVQTIVDNRAYHLNDDDEPLDMYEVVVRNLVPYGARLFQSQGHWWIISTSEMTHDLRLREYDAEGVFLEALVYSPVRAIEPPDDPPAELYWFGAQQRREFLPGYQLVTILQDYGLRDNFLPDGEFNNNDFIDTTHLKKWTWDAVIVQAGTPVNTGYEGSTNYIPPRAFSGEVIRQKKKADDPYGLFISGAYMQVDSFGRALLFKVYMDAGFFNLYARVYYVLSTGQIAVEQIDASTAEAEGGYIQNTVNNGKTANYRVCENGAVTKFVGIESAPFAQKDFTGDPCPITFGKPAFVRSQAMSIDAFAGQSIRLSITARVNTVERRYGVNARTEIAKFFQIRTSLRVGNYGYDGENEVWKQFNPDTEEAPQIYFSPARINEEDEYEIITTPLPISGDLYAEVGNLLTDGSRGYLSAQTSLYVRDYKLQVYKFGAPYPDSFQLSSVIDRRYAYVPDQVDIYHGDLPTGEKNMPLVYAGGMYLNVVSPSQLNFSRTMPGTEVGYGNDHTLLRGSGTSGILGRFSFDSEVYFVRAGNTIAQKEGPFLVKGFASSTNDIIINRPYSSDETNTPLSGYIFLSSELQPSIQPTRSWKRIGPTAIENEPEQLLLRIALQNRTLTHSQPSIRLGGVLKGELGFQHAITDPHMPGKVFVPAYYSYDDNQATVSGDWVEMGDGVAGDIDTNPPPNALHGNLMYENGQFQHYEDRVPRGTEQTV